MMDIIAVILVSYWIVSRVIAWCREKVKESLVVVQELSETAILQKNVITFQKKVIGSQEKLIAQLRKKTKAPTVEDYHTHIFSTKN